jgi:serine/threonine protein phosphatase PrpC
MEMKGWSGLRVRCKAGESVLTALNIAMEDAHTTEHSLEIDGKEVAFFGVYDGHGGSYAAKFCGQSLYKHVLADTSAGYKEALRKGFLSADNELKGGIDGFIKILCIRLTHLDVLPWLY